MRKKDALPSFLPPHDISNMLTVAHLNHRIISAHEHNIQIPAPQYDYHLQNSDTTPVELYPSHSGRLQVSVIRGNITTYIHSFWWYFPTLTANRTHIQLLNNFENVEDKTFQGNVKLRQYFILCQSRARGQTKVKQEKIH